MNCRSAESLFSAFVEDELSQEERRALEAHLLGCRRCSVSVRELRETMSLVASLPAVETTPHFEEDVLARVRSGDALRPSALEWLSGLLAPLRLRPLVAASAGVAAVAIASVVILRAPTPPDQPPRTPSVAAAPGSTLPVDAPVAAPVTEPAAPARSGAVTVAARPEVTADRPVAASRAGRRLTPSEIANLMTPDYQGLDADSGRALGRPLETRYQDEYILDQFLLDRASGRRDPSVVPVGGATGDDVYIEF